MLFVHVAGDPPDRSALSGGITALEDHDHSPVVSFEVFLELQQLDLIRLQLRVPVVLAQQLLDSLVVLPVLVAHVVFPIHSRVPLWPFNRPGPAHLDALGPGDRIGIGVLTGGIEQDGSVGEISQSQARRIASGSARLRRERPTGRVDRRHLRRIVDRMGLIQIDSVNVLARSQELVVFSRLGVHPRSLIWDATANGELFEYWVHEASHVPVGLHPYLRWHMARPERWKGPRPLRRRPA